MYEIRFDTSTERYHLIRTEDGAFIMDTETMAHALGLLHMLTKIRIDYARR